MVFRVCPSPGRVQSPEARQALDAVAVVWVGGAENVDRQRRRAASSPAALHSRPASDVERGGYHLGSP
jgi:hypothetical protein